MNLRTLILFFLVISYVKSISQNTNALNACTLFPQQNTYRQLQNISGIWQFKTDTDEKGENDQWKNGLTATKPIAVPASWNEQYDELRDYMGTAWYQQKVFVSNSWKGQEVFIRFGSVNYAATVWINGQYVGKHEGGHLPFSFNITNQLNWNSENLIVVKVENVLMPNRVPPGAVTSEGHFKNFPSGNYDFFPFCGIQRDVYLYTQPIVSIQDVTVKTSIENKLGRIHVTVSKHGKANYAQFVLTSEKDTIKKLVPLKADLVNVDIDVPNATFWSTENPYLYNLGISLLENKKALDAYQLKVGIRTIEVMNNQLLLNGKPIFLRGFGKHEDFPVVGKGTVNAVIVKDYGLMKWIGANSFRTSHYPYDEAYLNLADELGFLIIDETPAVGLVFEKNGALIAQRKEVCKQQITEMVQRDKNHPSVIMWSVANEPGLGSTYLKKETIDSTSFNFFKELVQTTKSLDISRPVTFVTANNAPYQWLNLVDVVCINRYFGWYSQSGNIAEGCRVLNKELEDLHVQFNKPIIITEFGADAQAGLHALNPEMFTEEYQKEFIQAYVELVETKSYVCGTHIWAFSDFKTSQGDKRFGGINWKGVFTRDRKPKMAAHYLHQKWNTK